MPDNEPRNVTRAAPHKRMRRVVNMFRPECAICFICMASVQICAILFFSDQIKDIVLACNVLYPALCTKMCSARTSDDSNKRE